MKLAIEGKTVDEVTTSLALVIEDGAAHLKGYQGVVVQTLATIRPNGTITLHETFFKVPFQLKK